VSVERRKVVILGAAGRDFHDFNTVYRSDPSVEVVAFTAAQIPFIERRVYPPELSGPLYPEGIPIRPEAELEDLVRQHGVDMVVLAYSDLAHEQVMHLASRSLALGADFLLLGPDRTMLRSREPVVSVCAVRTGCGKSGVARLIVRALREAGGRPVVLRHPMPYGDLLAERAERLGSIEDLDRFRCTVEEREEYELHIRAGAVVYAGVDYAEILARAEEEADVLVWDGGNNDLPFLRPDLEIVVLDPHRPGHELSYHPGEANLRRAHIAVVNKVDTARPENVAAVERNVRAVNPGAILVRAASTITAEDPDQIRGKTVLTVEDGPTVTHGGMSYGAATLAARRYGAAGLADPRPYARGSLHEAFAKYPHIENLLPALGYSGEQLEELRQAIEDTPCDLVLVGTPVDLKTLLGFRRPALRVRYEVEELGGDVLRQRARELLGRASDKSGRG
jgi:predicted GTPase